MRFCMHRHVELDRDARTVHCLDCGAQVDPFDYIAALASEFDDFLRRYREARTAAEAAERAAPRQVKRVRGRRVVSEPLPVRPSPMKGETRE